MADNQVYYAPYLPSDSELSDADSEFTDSPPPSPRPSDAEPEGEVSQTLGPDFAGFAHALQAQGAQPHSLKEPFDDSTTSAPQPNPAAPQPNPAALTLTNPAASAGPTLATDKQQIYYGTNRVGPNTFSQYPFQDVSGLTLQSTSKNTDTVVMLRSRDRDNSVYPFPTSCSLKLPRTYTNVTGLSIAQINLTSAFFYFSSEKQNVRIQIYEQGRITYPYTANPSVDSNGYVLPVTDSTGTPIPLIPVNTLRSGSYNIDQLLAELETQLNRTPLFYDFPNGFSDFYPLFSVNGDFSINFNYPGDTYYDSLRKVYIQNPTRAQVVSYYFNSQFANLFTYTVGQVRVAYYYPVLKEYLLDPESVQSKLTLSYTGYTTTALVQYILYNFTGMDDPIVGAVISANTTPLDAYRLQHTFRYSLINQYACTYDKTSNRISIQSASLNSSLVSLLTTQYNAILSQQLANYALSPAEYTNLSLLTTNLLSVIQAMYDYIQVALANYFAINYGTFSATYYTNVANTLLLREGINAANISIRYNAAVAASPRSNDLINDYRNNPPRFWTGMSNLGGVEGAQRNMGTTSDPFPISSNFPYNIAQSNIDLSRAFVDANGDIYTDARRSAGDILVNVDPGKYTIFKFRSQFRQTLQVETLPRQTQFVYPAYNKANTIPTSLSNLYDVSYCYVDPAPATPLFSKMTYDLSYNSIYGWSNIKGTSTNFGASFTTSANLWTFPGGLSNEKIDIASSNGRYYKFQTPFPPTAATGTTNTFSINVSFVSSNFPSLLYAFFYHDQAAFNADVGPSNIRNESLFHYKYKLTIPPDSTSNTYSFQAYANQTYYILLRPDSLTPNSTNYRIVPWFPNGSSFTTLQNITHFDPQQDPQTMLNNVNVALAQDSNFIRLPISSNLWVNKNPSNASINALLGSAPPVIGYDSNKVSNDLTDYIPFAAFDSGASILPTTTIRADPTNNYIFQLNSPYSLTYQTYFPSETANSLLTPFAATSYMWKGAAARQYKIVQYYSTTYLPDSSTVLTYNPATDISPHIAPYTLATTLSSAISPFNYQGANQTLVLGSGVCGFTFLPGDGTWAIDRIMFKTNFVSPSTENAKILLLGVFFTSEILAQPTSYISLDNAVAVCVKQGDTLYTENGLNIGFDAGLGTYSTFSNVPSLVTRTKFAITGFNQTTKVFIPDSNAYYSIVAFSASAAASNAASTSNWSALAPLLTAANGTALTYIQNLTGTPIAYPYANKPYVSKIFYGNTNSITPGNDLVLSTSEGNSSIYGPPQGADESMSKYEQSVPLVNSHIHYLDPANIVSQANPGPFSTWTGLPVQPTALGTSIPNTLLLQGNGFAIVNYSTYTTVTVDTPPNRVFTLQGELTIQQIFPDHEVTSLLGFSGTSTDYIFLGASNIPASPVSQLRFKRYTPSTGVMTELPINPNYTFSNSFQFQQFAFHNTGRWFLTSTDQTNVYLQGDVSYSSNTPSLITKVYAGQSVSELAMDCSGSYLYFASGATPGIGPQSGFTTLQLFTFDPTDTNGFFNTTPGYTITPIGSSVPTYYKQISVDKTATTEELILTNTDVYPSNFFKVRNYQPTLNITQSNANVDKSSAKYELDASTPLIPTRIYGGAKGSKWTLFDSPPFVQGNRYDAYDAPTSLSIAWQIFFPTIKIEMRKLSSSSTPITDLTSLTYPEWPHTAMFAYSSATALSNDLSNPPWDAIVNGSKVTYPASGKWGLESSNNFMVCDASFNGFYFNSYMMNVPLLPTASSTYYIAIRGWLPTEKFQTLLRFYLPNRYDFGFARIQDLSGEIFIATNATPAVAATFNPVYLTTLLSFNSNFVFTSKNFGSNATQGFLGSNLTSTGFGNFLTTYKTLYTAFTSNTAILQTVSSNVQKGLNTFIASNLRYILPQSNQSRQRFKDPLLFQIQWKSILLPIYSVLQDEWGLGWNMGFAKEDTGFSTVHTAPTFYKIQQDYIYLRLNPEFNINRMDAGGKENYATTRQPTGTTNQYYCKLLLTSFGGNATTFIHNPITFNPPLYRLTQMEFQWIDTQGNILANIDADWDATVSISELSFQTSLPMLSNYNPGQYITTPDPLPPGLATTQGKSS